MVDKLTIFYLTSFSNTSIKTLQDTLACNCLTELGSTQPLPIQKKKQLKQQGSSGKAVSWYRCCSGARAGRERLYSSLIHRALHSPDTATYHTAWDTTSARHWLIKILLPFIFVIYSVFPQNCYASEIRSWLIYMLQHAQVGYNFYQAWSPVFRQKVLNIVEVSILFFHTTHFLSYTINCLRVWKRAKMLFQVSSLLFEQRKTFSFKHVFLNSVLTKAVNGGITKAGIVSFYVPL